jgi:hypothetical protein
MNIVRRIVSKCVLAYVVAACGGDVVGTSPNVATFTVQVGSEQFAVRVTDQTTFERLNARMQSGTTGVILGRVAAGDGGFNGPWSWHLVPGTIQVVDFAIELCDGTPSHVEASRDEWIRTVREYCPWSAKVVAVRE